MSHRHASARREHIYFTSFETLKHRRLLRHEPSCLFLFSFIPPPCPLQGKKDIEKREVWRHTCLDTHRHMDVKGQGSKAASNLKQMRHGVKVEDAEEMRDAFQHTYGFDPTHDSPHFIWLRILRYTHTPYT